MLDLLEANIYSAMGFVNLLCTLEPVRKSTIRCIRKNEDRSGPMIIVNDHSKLSDICLKCVGYAAELYKVLKAQTKYS